MYKEYIAPAPAVRVYDEKLRILTQVPAYNRKIQNISFSNITTPEMQNKNNQKPANNTLPPTIMEVENGSLQE